MTRMRAAGRPRPKPGAGDLFEIDTVETTTRFNEVVEAAQQSIDDIDTLLNELAEEAANE